MKIRVFLFLLFFSYSPLLFAQNLVITLDWLDRAWADREIPAKQKIYINYIQALRVNNIVANDYESAWKVARMVYFLGNYGIGEEQFAHSKAGIEFFNYGVILAKKAIELNPDCIEAQYWYAVNLGSYGLVKGVMSAAINAKSGMKALKFVLKHNSDYQWGGASRILGKYYIKLPTMFGGDQAKAKESLIRATKDFNFSNNWLFLGQYYLEIKDYKSALESCKKALLAPKLDGLYEEARYRSEAKICIAQAQAH